MNKFKFLFENVMYIPKVPCFLVIQLEFQTKKKKNVYYKQ